MKISNLHEKTPYTETITTLRRTLRRQRRSLTATQQHQHSQQLAKRLCALPVIKKAKTIACYLSFDGEIDLSATIKKLSQMNKQIFLPKLHPLKHHPLLFLPFDPKANTHSNRYGIMESNLSIHSKLRLQALDVVLTPLVGFDAFGHRIGMGGGYYDRSFAFLRHRKQWQKPYLIGVAHEIQKVDHIQPQPWDVQLHTIITDKRRYP